MGFKFHQVHDVQSIQKRCQEKESRRLQRNLQRVQKSSKNLQECLNRSCEALQLPQSQDAQSEDQACNVDGNVPPEDSEPFMADTASNASDTRALTAPTASSYVDGQGNGLGFAPLDWGHSVAHGYGGVDPWPHAWANHCQTGDMFGWALGDTLATYSCLGDTQGRPGIGRAISTSGDGAEDGITRSAQPDHPLRVAPAASAGASFDLWDGRAAVVQPAERTTIPSSTQSIEDPASCISRRAQSEATTLVTSPRDPTSSRMEVLIKARPSQNATEYTAVPDYPTPSSDDCKFSEKSAKRTVGARKRSCNSASREIKAPQKTRDVNDTVFKDLRAKRHCGETEINHPPSNPLQDGIPPSPSPDLNELLTRATKFGGSQSGSMLSNTESQCLHALVTTLGESPAETPCTAALPIARSQSFGPRSPGQALTTVSGQFASVDTHEALPSNASLEDLLMSETPICGEVKEDIMLRLAFGALRDYILAPPCEGDGNFSKPPCHMPHLASQIITDEASNLDQSTLFSSSPSLDEVPHSTRDSGEPSDTESETRDASLRASRGQRGRWSPRDEARLRAYVLEDLSWSVMAEKLGRSESGVQQHWRIMESRDKARRRGGRSRA
ncbi:hypothetical protein AK830_g2824 [Neonectria ditissima]|uniref:Myb-like domain-containing protein n=1 Tax=Neonectria ditissima TaxID=78410 RepID=A0A0P7B1D2_9HYPO|nr:hypothetical protein AK830_g2824 [Neonectria ditissima]